MRKNIGGHLMKHGGEKYVNQLNAHHTIGC